jgi:hypothetical protein
MYTINYPITIDVKLLLKGSDTLSAVFSLRAGEFRRLLRYFFRLFYFRQRKNKLILLSQVIRLIIPMDIGHFVPGTDSMDSDAEIENHERQLEQTLLQLKIAKQFCTTDLQHGW